MGQHQAPLPFSESPLPQAVRDRLQRLFEAWLSSRPAARGSGRFREDSAEIYRDMWGAFVQFCVPVDHRTGGLLVRANPLEGLTTADLRLFLASAGTGSGASAKPRTRGGELSVRYAWRVLHLIERVLLASDSTGGLQSAAAARELMESEPYRYANAADRDPLPEVLTDAEVRRLIGELTAIATTEGDWAAPWKELRDRAAAGLMLGAGLSTGDVRALRLAGVTVEGGNVASIPWKLTIPADGTSPEHQAPVAEWAGRLLAAWLRVRASAQLPGDYVFPSTATGKPWAAPSCHLAMVQLLDRCAISGGNPFRLRHSFAVRQLEQGFSEDEVARWMGFVDTKPIKRYRHLVTRPVNVR